MNPILAFTCGYWNDAEHAAKQMDGVFGYLAWAKRVADLFNPVSSFIACGTWSDPAHGPLARGDFRVSVVNSGAENLGPYDVWYNQYAACAITAAMAYALNRNDWEFLVYLDTDSLVGAVNFRELFQEFRSRREALMTNQWNGSPGGNFMAFKRRGASMLLHERRRPNLTRDQSQPKPMLCESEWGLIFQGDWWDPWPKITNMRHDASVRLVNPNARAALAWPFVGQPHPSIVQEYLDTQSVKAVPV